MPESLPGAHWDKDTPSSASGVTQTAFNWNKQAQLETDQVSIRALFAAMVRKFGGVDALTAALNKEPSYASKITDAINGVKDRKVQDEWKAAMLDDPECMDLFLGWYSERTGHQPPVRQQRDIDPEAFAKASREVFAEMDADAREAYQRKLAKKLGVRREDVKL